jgi:hypothetical protein
VTPVVGSYENRNQPVGSIKGSGFLDNVSGYQHLKDCSHGVSE